MNGSTESGNGREVSALVEETHVTRDFFEHCMAEVKADISREINSVKTSITDTENTLVAGHNALVAKVDRINGTVASLKTWQLTHDGIELGRAQVSAGIRNWIILGFGLTTFLQVAVAAVVYLASHN